MTKTNSSSKASTKSKKGAQPPQLRAHTIWKKDFIAELRKDSPGTSYKVCNSKASRAWKNLPQEEKDALVAELIQ